jgi:hypothetical protein
MDEISRKRCSTEKILWIEASGQSSILQMDKERKAHNERGIPLMGNWDRNLDCLLGNALFTCLNLKSALLVMLPPRLGG